MFCVLSLLIGKSRHEQRRTDLCRHRLRFDMIRIFLKFFVRLNPIRFHSFGNTPGTNAIQSGHENKLAKYT